MVQEGAYWWALNIFDISRFFELRGWKERGIWCISEMREERGYQIRGYMVRPDERRPSETR